MPYLPLLGMHASICCPTILPSTALYARCHASCHDQLDSSAKMRQGMIMSQKVQVGVLPSSPSSIRRCPHAFLEIFVICHFFFAQ
jgi:hypothetical protein